MSFLPNDRITGTWRPASDQDTAFQTRFVAPGSATRGEFGMFEGRLAPGLGAVPHVHQGFSESFYVLDGSLRIRTGTEVRTATAGDFVYVPPTGVHAFRSTGETDARFLLIFAPGAPREDYFRAMAELAQRATPPTVEEIDEVARRHDQLNLRDPRWAID